MRKHVSAIIALLISAQASAVSIDLGPATGYNLFIKGDFTQSGADSQGKIAIGGNANIGKFDVGVNYEPGSKRDGLQFWKDTGTFSDVLVIGGNLTTSRNAWGNIKGNLVLGGQLTAGSSKNSVLGSTTKATPINFNTAFDQFSALSKTLAGQPNTGGVEFKYNNWLILNGSANDDVYFTTITGQTLAKATDLTAAGLDKNDTLVVNVSGKNINFDSLNYGKRESFAALNLSPTHILYNFFEAENISFKGGIKGNILAPNANFNFVQGDLSGQVIAKSWTGGNHAQANLWDGFFVPHVEVPLPPPITSTVPEPSVLWLLLAGLAAVLMSRRNRSLQS